MGKLQKNMVYTKKNLFASLKVTEESGVADPEGSETFGRIRIRSETEINVLDPDSNPDPKKICKKEHYFQAEIRWFHMIIFTSSNNNLCTVEK